MKGTKTPRSRRDPVMAQATPGAVGRALDWGLALAGAAALTLATGTARAEQAAALPITNVAAAFADLGPAQSEVLAESGAVDVTEVLAAPEPASEPAATAARLFGQGSASYYGRELAGRRTASGEVFNPADLTAAHRSLPFGTRLRVTNHSNGRSVVVRINDRGPYARNRVIDLSQGAAERIGLVAAGHGTVSMELIEG